MISQLTIDQVKSVSILDVCADLGLEVIHGKLCLCPFHDDHHPSMRLYPSTTNTYKCFSAKCGAQGGPIDLVMKHRGLNYPDAIRWIASQHGIYVDDDNDVHKRNRKSNAKLQMSHPTLPSVPVSHPSAQLADHCYLDSRLIDLRQSESSDFCRAVVACGLLSSQQMAHAAQRYRLGATRPAAGSRDPVSHVIYWYQDYCGNLREGKVMVYQPDCHRNKHVRPVTVSWLLKKAGHLPPTNRYTFCLFGEHLLAGNNDIAIVESEKTAVIMSEVVPDVTWLATGGMQALSVSNLLPLMSVAQGRRIVLFPDTDTDGSTYRLWCDIAAATARHGLNIAVSDILEARASPEQKSRKIDIMDLEKISSTMPSNS